MVMEDRGHIDPGMMSRVLQGIRTPGSQISFTIIMQMSKQLTRGPLKSTNGTMNLKLVHNHRIEAPRILTQLSLA